MRFRYAGDTPRSRAASACFTCRCRRRVRSFRPTLALRLLSFIRDWGGSYRGPTPLAVAAPARIYKPMVSDGAGLRRAESKIYKGRGSERASVHGEDGTRHTGCVSPQRRVLAGT